MKKVFLDEWIERYERASEDNLILTIEYLVLKKKEIDQNGYYEEEENR